MILYLDDIQNPPPYRGGYSDTVIVRTVENFVAIMKTGLVTEIDLDFDLGESDLQHTGVNALEWLLQCAQKQQDFKIPLIYIHSTHIDGRKEMEKLVQEIEAIVTKRRGTP